MAKHKRSRRHKAGATPSSNGPARTPFSDLEQTFFASAPPDDAEAPAEPERFDDLDDPITALAPRRAWTERVLAAIAAPRLDLRVITIAIASVMLLIGLSAVVFASRR
jgi:hypothetical protein